MNCYLHPDRAATAYCRTCGRPLCPEDQREIYGVIYCQECLARPLGQGAPAAAPAPAPGFEPSPYTAPQYVPPAMVSPHAPNPGISLLLGFIPGVGSIYNGQYLKAFVQVVIFAFLIAMANAADSDAIGTFAGLCIAAFYFYMVIDSYRTAKQMQAGQIPTDIFNLGPGTVNAPVAAIILIVIGAIFLLHSLGFFHYDFSRFLWPLLLIAIGVYLFFKQKGTGTPIA